jgi:hypothetical protein
VLNQDSREPLAEIVERIGDAWSNECRTLDGMGSWSVGVQSSRYSGGLPLKSIGTPSAARMAKPGDDI